jgi:hypothetical protein
MSYTPPSGTAVDFKLSGNAYTPPVGTAVDFSFSIGNVAILTFRCSIAAEANHQVAFTGAPFGVVFDADANHQVAFVVEPFPASITASANHQVAFTPTGEFPLDIAGDARPQLAWTGEDDYDIVYLPAVIESRASFYLQGTLVATGQLDLQPVVVGDARMVNAASASMTFGCSVATEAQYVYAPSADIELYVSIAGFTRRGLRAATAAMITPVIIDGEAASIYQATVAQELKPIVQAAAKFIYAAESVIQVPPVISGAAYIPGVEASCDAEIPIAIAATAYPGRAADAAIVFPIRIASTTRRKFRASSHNKLRVNLVGIAA